MSELLAAQPVEFYAQRLAEINGRITDASKSVQVDPADITLIVVSKFHSAEVVRALASLGVKNFGENKHQEASAKAADTADLDIVWHFVGQLQSKKARAAAQYASVIHSLDRESVVRALASFEGVVDGFIQINLTDDPNRGGVAPANLLEMAEKVLETQSINLKGVMAVAPLDEDASRAFDRLFGYSQDLLKVAPTAKAISAGMTHDFEEAIKSGATHLRIGSAITGNRPNPR